MSGITIRRQVAQTDTAGDIAATEIEHEFVPPSPTNHAQQLHPLLAERQLLIPGPRKQGLEDRICKLALQLAEALDQANTLLQKQPRVGVDAKPTPQPMKPGQTVINHAEQFQRYVDLFQQAPDLEARQSALAVVFALGKGMAEAIDIVNRAKPP